MNKQLINENYEKHCATPSDINEHLPTLYSLAKECETITEMGVRNVVSTWAFMLRNPLRLVGIDLHTNENVEAAKQIYPKWEFIQGDSTKVEISNTDLLFIDTLHIGSVLRKELNKHADKVNKYIVLHDVETYGYKPEPTDWQTPEIMENYLANDTGLMPVINEFLNNNENWYIYQHHKNNNGLMVLKRIKNGK